MNQTLADIKLLESQLLELGINAKHKSTVYSQNSEEVIEAAKMLDAFLHHPHPDSKECYWFVYKSKENPKVSIRVKGPTL
jgi:hypothetical protein